MKVDPNTSVYVPQIYQLRPETHNGSDWDSVEEDEEVKQDLTPTKVDKIPQEYQYTYQSPHINPQPYNKYLEQVLHCDDEDKMDLIVHNIAEITNNNPKSYLKHKQGFTSPTITFDFHELSLVQDYNELLMEISKFERLILNIELNQDQKRYSHTFLSLKEAREFLYAREWLIDKYIKNKRIDDLNKLIKNQLLLSSTAKCLITFLINQFMIIIAPLFIQIHSECINEIRSSLFITKILEVQDSTNTFIKYYLQYNGRMGTLVTHESRQNSLLIRNVKPRGSLLSRNNCVKKQLNLIKSIITTSIQLNFLQNIQWKSYTLITIVNSRLGWQ